MKLKYLLVTALGILTITTACGTNSKSSKEANTANQEQVTEQPNPATETPVEQTAAPQVSDVVCNGDPKKAEYIVISKETMTLKLYDSNNKVIFNFPVALGLNLGDKKKKGDKKTPEGDFTISQITAASTWSHDFGDGKGDIPHAYGDWFIRLLTPPHTGIGIHGTHDPSSIGTRASEGCIRLHNENLNKLKPLLFIGMKVRIETSRLDMEADGRLASSTATATATAAKEESTKQSEPQPTQQPATTTTEQPVAKEPEQKSTTTANNAAAGEIIEHTIASGELLGHIAIKYNTSTKRILELNPEVEPTKIRIGQKIRVEKGAPKQEAPKQEVVTDPNAEYYTIESGDVLGKIAEKHNTTVNKLLELNPGIEPTKIRPRQKIRVK